MMGSSNSFDGFHMNAPIYTHCDEFKQTNRVLETCKSVAFRAQCNHGKFRELKRGKWVLY